MTKAEEMLLLAERLERLNPDRMVGEKGTTFLYSEDIKAIVDALRAAPRSIDPAQSERKPGAFSVEYTVDDKGSIQLSEGAPFDGKPILIKLAAGWCEAYWEHERVGQNQDGTTYDGFCWVYMDGEGMADLDDVKFWTILPDTPSLSSTTRGGTAEQVAWWEEQCRQLTTENERLRGLAQTPTPEQSRTEKPCQWNDAMNDASTMGLPAPRPAEYGKEMRAYQKLCAKPKAANRPASFCSRCGGDDPRCYICGRRRAAKRRKEK